MPLAGVTSVKRSVRVPSGAMARSLRNSRPPELRAPRSGTREPGAEPGAGSAPPCTRYTSRSPSLSKSNNATPGARISGMYSLPDMPLTWTKSSPVSLARSTNQSRCGGAVGAPPRPQPGITVTTASASGTKARIRVTKVSGDSRVRSTVYVQPPATSAGRLGAS